MVRRNRDTIPLEVIGHYVGIVGDVEHRAYLDWERVLLGPYFDGRLIDPTNPRPFKVINTNSPPVHCDEFWSDLECHGRILAVSGG